MAESLKTTGNLALSLILLTCSFGAGPAQAPEPRDPQREVAGSRELMLQGRYDEAARRFADLAKRNPESPAGEFYRAVALTWKSYLDAKLETGSRQYDSEIEGLLDSAIKKAEARRARANSSKADETESLYYLGSAYAMRSRMSFFQNHAIPAARHARKAQDYMNELIKLDPDYPDSYFAAGSIYYRVGLVTDSPIGRLASRMLGAKALPEGDRERGLQYLRLAAERGAFTGEDAKLALLEVYTFNENRLDEALALARELESKYPGNQTFSRYLLRIYLGLKDRAKLSETARQVLGYVKAGRPNFGPFMKAEAERFLAEAAKL
jgi:hypothetical protein